MNQQQQQYQLKIAVQHHPSMKTDQLIEYLQNQSNEFLTNDLPGSLTTDNFFTLFQQIQGEVLDYSQFVGLVILYSSASVDSYNFAKAKIPEPQNLSDLFMLFIEMDNTQKKTNAIGDEGEKMCARNGYQFVRLSLQNSEDLLTFLNKNLYQLIQNYYYPNQQQKPSKGNLDSQYVFHYSSSQPNVLATKEERKSIQTLLGKAQQLRHSRQNQLYQQQQEIDDSIQNVQRVLNNINRHIKEKKQAEWYTSLKHTLYSPLEKNSVSFAKIKLTQQFIDGDEEEKGRKKGKYQSENGLFGSRVSHNAVYNKFVNKHKKLQPVMKLILAVAESVIIQVDVYENSTYDDLAIIGIRKLGISETQHNFNIMKRIIAKKIEDFVKELSRAVKNTQKQRIDERSYLSKHNLSSHR